MSSLSMHCKHLNAQKKSSARSLNSRCVRSYDDDSIVHYRPLRPRAEGEMVWRPETSFANSLKRLPAAVVSGNWVQLIRLFWLPNASPLRQAEWRQQTVSRTVEMVRNYFVGCIEMRMRRYSICPRSPSSPIGPVSGTFRASSITSPLHAQ
jgi:hypothetical protein